MGNKTLLASSQTDNTQQCRHFLYIHAYTHIEKVKRKAKNRHLSVSSYIYIYIYIFQQHTYLYIHIFHYSTLSFLLLYQTQIINLYHLLKSTNAPSQTNMNFLDLSNASEAERKFISEILSDTSVVNIKTPLKPNNNSSISGPINTLNSNKQTNKVVDLPASCSVIKKVELPNQREAKVTLNANPSTTEIANSSNNNSKNKSDLLPNDKDEQNEENNRQPEQRTLPQSPDTCKPQQIVIQRNQQPTAILQNNDHSLKHHQQQPQSSQRAIPAAASTHRTSSQLQQHTNTQNRFQQQTKLQQNSHQQPSANITSKSSNVANQTYHRVVEQQSNFASESMQQQQQHPSATNAVAVGADKANEIPVVPVAATVPTVAPAAAPAVQMPYVSGPEMTNPVIGLDMAPQHGYGVPTHVAAFPTPRHVYAGPPIFQSYGYILPYHPQTYVPFVMPPGSVVPRRPVQPLASEQSSSNQMNENQQSRHQQQQQHHHSHHNHHHSHHNSHHNNQHHNNHHYVDHQHHVQQRNNQVVYDNDEHSVANSQLNNMKNSPPVTHYSKQQHQKTSQFKKVKSSPQNLNREISKETTNCTNNANEMKLDHEQSSVAKATVPTVLTNNTNSTPTDLHNHHLNNNHQDHQRDKKKEENEKEVNVVGDNEQVVENADDVQLTSPATSPPASESSSSWSNNPNKQSWADLFKSKNS